MAHRIDPAKIQSILASVEPNKSSILFVPSTSSTNPFTVTLAHPLKFNKISLKGYIIKGAPVTSSVPDHPWYTVQFLYARQISAQNDWNRADQYYGFSIPLTGSYTEKVYDTPLLIADLKSPDEIKNFKIQVNDTNNSAATFSSIAFWFILE